MIEKLLLGVISCLYSFLFFKMIILLNQWRVRRYVVYVCTSMLKFSHKVSLFKHFSKFSNFFFCITYRHVYWCNMSLSAARKNISVSNSPYKKRKSFRKGNGKLKMLKVQVASKRRKGGGKDMGVPHIHLKWVSR